MEFPYGKDWIDLVQAITLPLAVIGIGIFNVFLQKKIHSDNIELQKTIASNNQRLQEIIISDKRNFLKIKNKNDLLKPRIAVMNKLQKLSLYLVTKEFDPKSRPLKPFSILEAYHLLDEMRPLFPFTLRQLSLDIINKIYKETISEIHDMKASSSRYRKALDDYTEFNQLFYKYTNLEEEIKD